MKTNRLKSVTIKPALALTAMLLGAAANAAPMRDSPGIETARLMYLAGQQDALADLNVALANANNVATEGGRKKAAKRANADYNDELVKVKEQFAARKRLVRVLAETRYNPQINPASFLSPAEMAAAPNPLFPLVPGTTYTYRSVDKEGTEVVTFEVTRRTRVILGVTCTVVHDAVLLNGSLIEDTDDWFAQDREGNVWYFGESTAEYENGLILNTNGQWEAGVEGALPGIIMFAKPKVGKTYRQEMFLDDAEDAALVLDLASTVTVPAGNFVSCVKTQDFSPIEPGKFEHKYYAPGIGTVLVVSPDSGKRSELISVVKK